MIYLKKYIHTVGPKSELTLTILILLLLYLIYNGPYRYNFFFDSQLFALQLKKTQQKSLHFIRLWRFH